MKIGVVIALTALAALARATVARSSDDTGKEATQTRPVEAFERVRLTIPADVQVVVGRERAVRVIADEGVIERIVTEVREGTLVLASKRGGYSTRRKVRIEIATPTLNGATLAGTGAIQIEGLAAERFVAELFGTGRIQAAGTTARLEATLSGTGEMSLKDLAARETRATLRGTGTMDVQATDALMARLHGVGQVRYFGNPSRRDLKVHGIGKIRQG